jgi:maltodextrin utilization protein YvdJ
VFDSVIAGCGDRRPGRRSTDMMWWQVVLLVAFLAAVTYYTVKVIRPPEK